MGFDKPYAELAWVPDDVKTLRPKWSMERCERELSRIQKHVRDRLCELGWEVIDTLLPREKEKEK